MSIGKWVRNGILAAAGIAAVILIVGRLSSRQARTIRLSVLTPERVELVKGTAVTYERRLVGSVKEMGDPAWAMPLDLRVASAHPVWIPVVLLPGESARAGPAGDELTLRLDPSDSLLFLESGAGDRLVLRRLAGEGTWIGGGSKGDSVRVGPGEVLSMGGTEIRFGEFGKFRKTVVDLTTRRLCTTHSGFFPDSAEQATCARRALGGDARLSIAGTFGLTKPVLTLSAADTLAVVPAQAEARRLPLAAGTDLQAEVNKMLSYLNSAETERRQPRTHFEHTVARVNQTLQSVDSVARAAKQTVRKLQTAMDSEDGLGPLVLGNKGYLSLRTNLANVERITDPGKSLVENVGLGKLLGKGDSTMTQADSTMRAVRLQLERLAPRIELAIEGTARTIEGAEGTLVSLKAAGEDIQAIKRGAQSASPYAIKGGALLVLSQLLAGIAGLVYIIH